MAFQALIDVMAQLRSPDGGCPWDLDQTPQTLIPYVIEEAFEVADALRREDQAAIVEELGDLLLQVIFQSQIAQETHQFTLQAVIDGIREKLIRRHPHVFGDVQVQNSAEVNENWEKIKAQEKGETPDQDLTPKLRRYARTLPPLSAALKISRKAAAVGFEWETIEQVWEKFEEELGEFRDALQHSDPVHQQEELGDLLFTVVNLARWYDLDPAEALHGTNDRFIQRFGQVEQVAGRSLETLSLEELEILWQQAKARVRSNT
jgi:XTP/dITP diphosphohydrolase